MRKNCFKAPMKYGCPNLRCKFHQKKDFILNDGYYFRKNDSRMIKRYRCSHCQKRFSSATFSLAYRQKKRRINHLLKNLLSSGVSMRRAAIILKIHRKTVKRKVDFLAKKSQIEHHNFLETLKINKVQHMQFDDLITIEHTKLKPLSVSLAIDENNRRILGIEVSQIPAFGKLAAFSRKKYGYRKNTHKKAMNKLFFKLKDIISSKGIIETDEHKQYPGMIKKYFPSVEHKRYLGGRSCIAGQGELKKLHYDPLFKLNHTCAMLRANVNRLIRKTWCTTKDPHMLQKHLQIYMSYHNQNVCKNL